MGYLRELDIYNDMPRGWLDNPLSRKIYDLWRGMWRRCSAPPDSRNYKYYKDCIVCEEFRLLSNFVSWIESEPNYQDFCSSHQNIRWSIDKDIKVEGNKIYHPDYISLVTFYDNNKHRLEKYGNPFSNRDIIEKTHAKTRKPCIAIPLKQELPILFFYTRGSTYDLGFNPGHVGECCNGKRNKHKDYKWYWITLITL